MNRPPLKYQNTCNQSCCKRVRAYAWERIRRPSFLRIVYIRLLSFSYGLQLENWKLCMGDDFPCLFMEFWNMVDKPERAIPGAWEGGDNQTLPKESNISSTKFETFYSHYRARVPNSQRSPKNY